MEPSRRYFTESCKKITTHATITDGYIPSVFTVDITDEIFTTHATITDGQSVGDLSLEIQTKHVRR
jgi:hypothetical protein